MTKILLIIFFIFLSNVSLSQNMTSEKFIYNKLYECGPKKYEMFEVDQVELYKYYFIHFDKYNNVVILNDRVQFKSFEKIVNSELYHQNGGEHTLEFSKNDSSYIFKLITKLFRPVPNQEYSVGTLIFDETNLTYQIRISRQNNKKQTTKTFNIRTGFCTKIKL
jgi:hypothetical protein